MKKIIKPGKKEFVAICPTCGCQFKYEISDVSFNSVQCPDCFHFVGHPSQDGEEENEDG